MIPEIRKNLVLLRELNRNGFTTRLVSETLGLLAEMERSINGSKPTYRPDPFGLPSRVTRRGPDVDHHEHDVTQFGTMD
jgi:hypothetical protein